MSNDHDYTPDEAAALEAVGHASAMSRNDPNYIADLEEVKRDIDSVANEVRSVTLVDDGKRGHHIEVDLARPKHKPAARTTAFTLGRLLEAEVRVDGGSPRAGDSPSTIGKQPPRHTHYKDDRKG